MVVLNEILIKPEWWIKLKDEAIAAKWKGEIRSGITALLKPDGGELEDVHGNAEDTKENLVAHVVDSEFVNQVTDYLFQELHYIANNRLITQKNGAIISPTSSHGVFISDSLIPREMVSQLAQHAASLEAISFAKAKWHEGSDGKVLDLIHPSDYCLVYGRSYQRERMTQPVGCKVLKYKGPNGGDISRKFQWLPTEFKVNGDGNVSIRSYINNLNRCQHPELQSSILSVFETMVPMFELALGSLQSVPVNRIRAPLANNAYQLSQGRWELDEYLRDKYGANVNLNDQALRHSALYDDDYDEFVDNLMERISRRPVNIPGLPTEFSSLNDSEVCRFSLAGRNLQVIVKMASIHLSPEKPVFNGGSWHLEGMENEAIAATGILYYSMDNITSSRLTFRNVHESDRDGVFEYEQSDFGGLEKVFNFTNEVSTNVQVCGQIEARENRCVVFPNYLQHKVEDFELLDKTQPGHRKILAFFLVHPDFKVNSTADVGMQQLEWLAAELYGICGLGSKLPLEVVRLIAGFTRATLTEKQAQRVAHLVMEERKNTPKDGYANVQSIFLCEH
ncbi:hypothetical protein HDU79_011255 [Rhizoclosmatium sp. JEL0117]|nr:hypothetical protein HDU79_011255 [Rhizoclosmatium sp. JEL0117]